MRLNAAPRCTGRSLVDVPGIVGAEDLDSFFKGFGNGELRSIVGHGNRDWVVDATFTFARFQGMHAPGMEELAFGGEGLDTMVELIGDTNDSTRGIDPGWLCHQSRVAAAASDLCKELAVALEDLDPVIVGVGNGNAPIGKYRNAGWSSKLPGSRTTFTDDPNR